MSTMTTTPASPLLRSSATSISSTPTASRPTQRCQNRIGQRRPRLWSISACRWSLCVLPILRHQIPGDGLAGVTRDIDGTRPP